MRTHSAPPKPASRLALVLALLVLPLCSGCGVFSTLLKLNPDGSGTIEETVKLNPMASQFLGSMASMGDTTEQGSDPGAAMFKEEEIRARAAQMGEGVRFVRMERLNEMGAQGYRAVYAFDDVRTVRLSSSPDDKMPSGLEGNDAPSSLAEEITFDFESGSPAVLTMHLPKMTDMENDSDADPNETPPDTSAIQQQMGMMQMLMRDALMRVAIEPQGAVVETNASHRSPEGRITLMEMNFNELLAEPEALQRLMLAEEQNLSDAEMEEVMKDMPGIQIETQETVQLRFR